MPPGVTRHYRMKIYFYRMKIFLPNENIPLNGSMFYRMKTIYQMKIFFLSNENIFYRMEIYILSNKNIFIKWKYFYRMQIYFYRMKTFFNRILLYFGSHICQLLAAMGLIFSQSAGLISRRFQWNPQGPWHGSILHDQKLPRASQRLEATLSRWRGR